MSKEYGIKLISLITVMLLCMLLIGCTNDDSPSIAISEPLEKSQITKLSIESKYLDKKVPSIVYLPKGYNPYMKNYSYAI